MSAPTPAPGDDTPREGYYPDPSIPGYVRYWNGSAWVPGTSRPAPTDGRPLPPPPGVSPQAAARPAAPAPAPGPAPAPPASPGADRPSGDSGRPAAPLPSPSPAPAPAVSPPVVPQSFGAVDETGPQFLDTSDEIVTEMAPETGRTPVVPSPTPAPGPPPAPVTSQPSQPSHLDGGNSAPPAGGSGWDAVRAGSAERPRPVSWGSAGQETPDPRSVADQQSEQRPSQEGTMVFRTRPAAEQSPAGPQGPQQAAAPVPAPAPAPVPAPAPAPASAPIPASSPWPQQSGHLAGDQAAAQAAAAQAAAAQAALARASAAHAAAQATPQAAAQGPAAPWKPVQEDPFTAAARRQASARPAPLGSRVAARLIDLVLVGAVTAAAAVPLGMRAWEHVQDKLEAARLSGEKVTVWLVDGTTGVQLGIVLAVLVVAGVLLEVLPTSRTGRTPGKKLLGLQVRDIEGHEPPSFGTALLRWAVGTIPTLLVVGVIGHLWALFDRPWRQAWHDKAAHTFVAGR
ncbi:RDD family protein [Streptomyces fragilis]|uniref:RDD family protein n=1 Tax=Streptomyces fragilis TaxID=67301 RepID=A0ABV2YDQ2_9ACTN|nr:RDD family protein [Streptomyces fragilis]